MSALHPKADMCSAVAYVRFVPKADIHGLNSESRHLLARFPRRLVPRADIQAAFEYYCWWVRVLKFVEHHP